MLHSQVCGAHKLKQIGRPQFEIADILRMARDNGHLDLQSLTPARAKVLHAISSCRTAALGGHADACVDCGSIAVSYNSCRNRHCPRCQWAAQEKWIAGRLERLLDTHFFHVVFTLPAGLRPIALCNQRQIYSLLFRAASHTLLELGEDPKRLGATLGITAVLHTWQRDLSYHPHLHCLVTGGGLSLDKSRWVSSRRRYLFPIHVMGALFRGKFLSGLRKLADDGELVGTDGPKFDALISRLYETKWLVYAKRPMAGPEQVIKYLGRYTHRVAISNSRLVDVTDETITFITRNDKTVQLSPGEFARRFLLHVLPKSFVKIRHYGLFAGANIKTKWATARLLRPVEVESPSEKDVPVAACEACGSTRLHRVEVRPHEDICAVLQRYERIRIVAASRGPPTAIDAGGNR